MTINYFEDAIEKSEIPEFFRGENKYFVPSRDYEGHVHGAHMGGCARVYAEHSKTNARAFDAAFLQFLNSLSISKEDFGHLLANLSSFFAQRSRGGFPESDLFNDTESPESYALREYLKDIYESPLRAEIEAQADRHAKFISRKGYNLLENIIFDVK